MLFELVFKNLESAKNTSVTFFRINLRIQIFFARTLAAEVLVKLVSGPELIICGGGNIALPTRICFPLSSNMFIDSVASAAADKTVRKKSHSKIDDRNFSYE